MAKKFLELLRLDPLPLFNPLQQNAEHNEARQNVINPSIANKEWHTEAKQLHNAINLIIVCWNRPIGGALLDIKTKLERFYDKEPFISQIKAINTILSYDREGRTLSQQIAELAQGNNIRNFTFDALNKRLGNEKINSNFG